MKKAVLFIFILLLTGALWAQNRHALVIGNANYPRAEDRLPNAINDTNDVSAALRELDFNPVLRQNLNRLDMVREISAFITRLGSDRNSEGFLWYAGHAMEINGEIFLFPLDVNVEDDELIRATSFSLNDLTRQFEGVRNKVNVLVLDACRVPPSGRGRGRDATRIIKDVPLPPSDMLVFYSTAPGTVASDGAEGKRNSPFAEAFLKNIRSAEPITIMSGHVTRDTLTLTGNRQRPHISGSIGSNAYYSLNPSGGQHPNPNPNPNPNPAVSLYDQLVNATGTVTITVTQNAELPLETVISRASFITLRGDTASRTVLGNGSNRITIERGVTLTLENITLRGVRIYVNAGGTLVMNNGSTITGCTYVGYIFSGVHVYDGTFSMSGGTISANSQGVDISGGTFTMSGGTISNNTGRGVDVSNGTHYGRGNGTFTMSGGTISNNTFGGVDVYSTFTMRGGTISGNTRDRGGGVYVGNNGTFTMSGGTISGNTARDRGGGVHVDGTFTMRGGTISSNIAGSAGGGVSVHGTFRMTDGTIYGSNGGSNANRAAGSLIKGHALYDGNLIIFNTQDLTITKYN